eukprot:scaffold50066_cov15-Tisochrysis_lutea.AAC.1
MPALPGSVRCQPRVHACRPCQPEGSMSPQAWASSKGMKDSKWLSAEIKWIASWRGPLTLRSPADIKCVSRCSKSGLSALTGTLLECLTHASLSSHSHGTQTMTAP